MCVKAIASLLSVCVSLSTFLSLFPPANAARANADRSALIAIEERVLNKFLLSLRARGYRPAIFRHEIAEADNVTLRLATRTPTRDRLNPAKMREP